MKSDLGGIGCARGGEVGRQSGELVGEDEVEDKPESDAGGVGGSCVVREYVIGGDKGAGGGGGAYVLDDGTR